MSKYHRDEFDRVPESSARQGVHRARLEPPKGNGIALMVASGVLALIIGAAAYLILPNLGLFSDSSPAAVSSPAVQTSAPAANDAGPEETGPASEPSAEAPPEEPSAAPSEPDEEPEEEAAAVDKTVPVVVLNSTGIAGLAGTAGDRLAGDGWPISLVGNWGGMPQSTSTVFYNGADQLANAEAIGELLNITQLTPTTQIAEPLTVVVGPGFQ